MFDRTIISSCSVGCSVIPPGTILLSMINAPELTAHEYSTSLYSKKYNRISVLSDMISMTVRFSIIASGLSLLTVM